MKDQRNLVTFFIVAAIILIGWEFAASRFFPVANPPATKVVNGKSVPLPKPQAGAVVNTPEAIRDRNIVLGETPRIAIATPRVQGSINLKGARIDDLVLTLHRETIAKNSPPVRLLSPSGAADAYFASFGWLGDNVRLPGPDALWTASGNRLTPQTPVTLSWDNGGGQHFEIRLSVDDGYLFTADQKVVNAGPAPVTLRPYALVSRTGISKDPSTWTMHTGPVGYLEGQTNYDVSFKNLDKDGDSRFNTTGGWLGFGDKYWQTALVPPQNGRVDAAFRAGSGSYQADFAMAPKAVGPNQAVQTQTRFFAGAKEVALLDRYTDQGIPKFDRAIDWGWFYWFERPIFSLLQWLFHLIGNFGVAIMCLTLIVRAIMFPIAQKQFASFAAMRVVQPKVKALQERYKEDKPKLQEEMLKLYREEKVNPAAGCLPTLLQIPVFYALYKVLMLTIEMRHQPFVLWIKDLSAPDPATVLNAFGYLPFTPPHILAIGVLPILVGITMFIQFKLNPQQGDPVQQQMFSIMPWVLMFVMAPFAAGLQLYWATSNTLTILQQRWLYSRHPGMKNPAPAK